jgi:4-diphosphocytidyl-2-C-methyl-D-erythritol kinase
VLNAPKEDLAQIAASIGADCPFFIYNTPKLATGIGTDFSDINIDLNGYKIIVVKPQVSVPTAQAYAGVTPCVPATPLSSLISLPINQWQKSIKNDFEKSIFPLHPIINDIKQRFIDMGAEYASMSGSGSAIYGIFKGDKLAEDNIPTFEQCDIFIGNL